MERLRGYVRPVRPNDRSQLLVQFDLPEIAWIPQRLKDTSPGASRKVDLSFTAILETQMDPVIPDYLDTRDMNNRLHALKCYGSGSTWAKGCSFPCSLPIELKLITVNACPSAHQGQAFMR